MPDGEEFEQATFRDGRVVRGPSGPDGTVDPGSVVPDEETGFRVALKPGAVEANPAVADVRAEHGDVVSFGSRSRAEAFAALLSADGRGVRVQAAAPNDPDDVDAYLLADHEPSVAEPAAVDGDTLTFDVGANRYGALGEALVAGGPDAPALEHFVRQDLADADLAAELRIRVTDGEYVSVGDAGEGGAGWLPDCRVVASDGRDGRILETYWCEIKTGEASFERTQVEAMRSLASHERVLKVRVLIDDLPEQYSVRIREVEPE